MDLLTPWINKIKNMLKKLTIFQKCFHCEMKEDKVVQSKMTL